MSAERLARIALHSMKRSRDRAFLGRSRRSRAGVSSSTSRASGFKINALASACQGRNLPHLLHDQPWTSVATMMLVEEGRIRLTDPISKFLPN